MALSENHSAIRRFRRLRQPSQLYRLFSDEGELLYVGISVNAKRRIYQHKCTADWAHLICKHTIEDFAIREDAISAEEAAIKAEKPAYNIKFSGRGSRPPAPAKSRVLDYPKVNVEEMMREVAEMAHMIQTYDPSIEGEEEKAMARLVAEMAEYKRKKAIESADTPAPDWPKG